MFGMGLLKGLRATGTHFVKPKVTELYPEQRPDPAPASQGCGARAGAWKDVYL